MNVHFETHKTTIYLTTIYKNQVRGMRELLVSMGKLTQKHAAQSTMSAHVLQLTEVKRGGSSLHTRCCHVPAVKRNHGFLVLEGELNRLLQARMYLCRGEL